MHRYGTLMVCVSFGLLAAGCPKGQTDYNQGRKAETLQDYDAAFDYYLKALKADPNNASFKIKLNQTRFEAGALHVKQGAKLRETGDLQGAIAQFQRAQVIDPSSPVADQELRKTLEMLAEKNRATDAAAEPVPDPNEQQLASMPPEIKPLSPAPINLKMSNDAKLVFDTIGKLAGLTVIDDPAFPPRGIPPALNKGRLDRGSARASIQ